MSLNWISAHWSSLLKIYETWWKLRFLFSFPVTIADKSLVKIGKSKSKPNQSTEILSVVLPIFFFSLVMTFFGITDIAVKNIPVFQNNYRHKDFSEFWQTISLHSKLNNGFKQICDIWTCKLLYYSHFFWYFDKFWTPYFRSL